MRSTAAGVLLALVCTVGCSSAYRRTEGQWVPGKALSPHSKILLLPVTGRDSEACEMMTGALIGKLSQKGLNVVLSDVKRKQSGAAALSHGLGQGYDYVLEGLLSKWEDKSSGDEAELTLKLYEVSSGEVVASAVHYDHGRANHWPSDPKDFITELADCALAKIFGWKPGVYEGDPN